MKNGIRSGRRKRAGQETMETNCRKVLALACTMMSSAMALCDGAATNGTMSANANQTTNANASIEASIRVVAAGLAGNADVHAMHDTAAGLFSRIASEDDAGAFRVHMESMQNAILGIRFREGPLADSYDDWARSIDRFDDMCDRCSTTMWKQTRDWQWLWEFRLKQMGVYRKELERIADAQPKLSPPNFCGVHHDLSSVRGLLRYRLSELVRLSFASSEQFAIFYHDLPPNEKEVWRNRIETASGMKFDFSEEGKQHVRDVTMRKPYDGGDILPHPFTLFGCTLGVAHTNANPQSKSTYQEVVSHWNESFKLTPPYFGAHAMFAKLAPRSKLAYSVFVIWSNLNTKTRDERFALAKDIKADIEKRLGVALGEFFFEVKNHVCDESAWRDADFACARSCSVFGPIKIEIYATGGSFYHRTIRLVITDTAAEALVEKERKENPLTYDSKAEKEAERRRFERPACAVSDVCGLQRRWFLV